MSQDNKQKDDYKKLSGIQKTAIFLLSVGEEHAAKMFSLMEDDEIKDVSHAMAGLGRVSAEVVEQLFMEFSDQLSAGGGIVGSHEGTEKLLMKALGKDRVDDIMEDIRGPAGRTTWEKLGNVNEEILAAYLKNEYPQTIALVLSKITSAHAARVLSVLPEDLAMEVVTRMLSMEAIKKEVLQGIENTLKVEFMNNLARTQRRDSFEMMAEIFNNFDRNTESRFMSNLEDRDTDSAEHIRALMFTFEDLVKIDPSGIQVLMRGIDKDKLAIALKGASEAIKDLFFSNMSERASKILREDMEAMGPVRLRDVDEAQMYIVMSAKDLAAKGELIIADASGEEQLIY
ncbi:MAG: flagellar motor switch protein FliG [Alphaproteobacteria bacterium]|nr:flagellar motor switch protein FliG [Alphaproteobacteria bacterium]